MATTGGLEEVVACPGLPSLPAIAVQVLDLTDNPDVELDEIARVVGSDQALAGRILRTVNSSYYGLVKPCPSISRAMAYLGLNTVKALTLGFSLIDMARQSEGGFDLVSYWRRCVHSAVAARRIGRFTATCDPEEAFLAGLMQDVGMLALQAAMPDLYAEVIRRTGRDHGRLAAEERGAFGFDHADVGVELGRRWHFPGQLVESIGHHHHEEIPSGPHEAVVRAVLLADQMAAVIQSCEAASLSQACNTALRLYGMTSEDVKTLLVAAAEDATNLAALLGVKIGGRPPDVKAILARADEARIRLQLGIQREAEQLRRSNLELIRQAMMDGLTRVGNRKHFNQEIARKFEEAIVDKNCLGVILADADKFKTVNDTHGHQAGDAALVEIARRISEVIGEEGIVCRYGGEEFIALLPGANRPATARIAERVRLAMAERPVSLAEVDCEASCVDITISLGVAVYEPAVAELIIRPDQLVRATDLALYAAKEAGRNCVRIFFANAAVADGRNVA